MQNVGKTVQALRKRMYNHKSTLKEHKSNTVLCHHYNLNDHFQDNNKGFINVKVQIIDYLNENDKKAENNNQILETLEEFHMKRLVSLYPFGFNDKVTSSNDILIKIDLNKFNKNNTIYFSQTITRNERSHGIRKRKPKPSKLHIKDIMIITSNLKKKYDIRNLYLILRSLSQNTLIKLKNLVVKEKDMHTKAFIDSIIAYTSQFTTKLENKDSKHIYI